MYFTVLLSYHGLIIEVVLCGIASYNCQSLYNSQMNIILLIFVFRSDVYRFFFSFVFGIESSYLCTFVVGGNVTLLASLIFKLKFIKQYNFQLSIIAVE